MKYTNRTPRLLCRCVVEAATPLAVGSGKNDILTDKLVATDVNGLPYIPGTSLAGVLRHSLKSSGVDTDSIFGYAKSQEGMGSKVIITDAVLLDGCGRALDGLQPTVVNGTCSDFVRHYLVLPIRQHVAIDGKGVAQKRGKFDEQVVFKGSRFCFEMEMLCEADDDKQMFDRIIATLHKPGFRLGGGTRNGFGELRVESCSMRLYATDDDWKDYARKSSSLAADWQGDSHTLDKSDSGYITYTLRLKPDDFFLFSAPFGDDDADRIPVVEDVVEWDSEGKGRFERGRVLIPATSVKGAIRHRTAYWYNKLQGHFVDNDEATEGDSNVAVKQLFGSIGDDGKTSQPGRAFFSDCFVKTTDAKIFNHVSIDRLTGGSLDSALYDEKASFSKEEIAMTILVDRQAFATDDTHIKEAFEHALRDICEGMLPLGGAVNHGLGIFSGTLTVTQPTDNQ